MEMALALISTNEGIVVAEGQGQRDALTQLFSPRGIFVDTQGTLYVADGNNDRVIRQPQEAKQGIVIIGNGKGVETDQLNRPESLALDQYGNLYVSEGDNHRVQQYSLSNFDHN